jgi:hypothetical protein
MSGTVKYRRNLEVGWALSPSGTVKYLQDLESGGVPSAEASGGKKGGRGEVRREGKEGEAFGPVGCPNGAAGRTKTYRDRPGPRRGKRRMTVDRSYTKMVSL